MININGKEYRNIQEQVEKNQEDIQDLQDTSATKDYVDNSISALYGDFYTREQADARFPTETHMNLLLGYKQDILTEGTGINISNNEISVDTNTIATVATLQSFTQSFGGEINAIYSGTSTVGKARQDALGRTIDEYYASKTQVPDAPTSTDGTYVLKATVSNGQVTYSWVLENNN